MKNINIELIIHISKVTAILYKSFDSKLGGLGLTDFLVLYHLSEDKDKTMRRIDIADKLGYTASCITKVLLPMEKIGLITKEKNKQDARVSLVKISVAGQEMLTNATNRINEVSTDIFGNDETKITSYIKYMEEIGGKLLWR